MDVARIELGSIESTHQGTNYSATEDSAARHLFIMARPDNS